MKHTPLRRKTALHQRGQSESAKARQRNRAEAKAKVKSEIETCIWPGCKRPGVEAAHGYGTGAHPEQHDDPLNLWPCCRTHHRTGSLNLTYTPELTRALQDLTDERRLLVRHGQALPYERVRVRFYEAFGEILRNAPWPARLRYAKYLRVELPPELMETGD